MRDIPTNQTVYDLDFLKYLLPFMSNDQRKASRKRERDRSLWLLRCFCIPAVLLMGAVAHAQPAPTAPPTAETSGAPPPGAATPAPIPLAEIATDAESATARVRDMQSELSSDRTTEIIAEQLPALTREIDARLRENWKIIAQRPSIEMLANIEAGLRRHRRNLSGWMRALTSRVSQVEGETAELDELENTWKQTSQAARASNSPPEVLRRIEAVITGISQARESLNKHGARALTVQNRVAAQNSRIADALRSVARSREDVLNRLFIKDGPPIWTSTVESTTRQNLQEEIRTSFSTQWAAVNLYASRQTVSFFIHAAVFLTLATGLSWARRHVRPNITDEADQPRASVVLEMPIVAALLLSSLCSRWIYPEAPRLLWAVLVGLLLLPSVIIVRRRLERDLYPTLYALVVFYFIDQLRTVFAAVQFVPRLLLVGELLGAALFLGWLIRSVRRLQRFNPQANHLRKTIKLAACIALATSLLALIANIAGYVTLATLLGDALLTSAYVAFILYAVVEVLDGLVTIALRLPPFALLSVVDRQRQLLQRRLRRGFQWLAVLLWVLFVLERLLLRERLFRGISEILSAQLAIGTLRISLGDVLAFGITVWGAFLISRFVRFLLDEDVYPRVHLRRGLPYAISTMLHYIILLVGFFAAVAALGIDMTRVTILAGAFSVGVGLGLQNIFNNFVSGLILLFERPVNVGDVVQIEDASGVVERIGIRASIIRTTNGSEVIVPNGKLISERLINWTLSSRQHGIELPIAVANGTDPNRVIALLERTAAEHPLVAGDPPPKALVVKLGPESLGLELRAWSDHSEQWMQIRSELAIAISAALAAEEIAIR